jgi:hypothetical protein
MLRQPELAERYRTLVRDGAESLLSRSPREAHRRVRPGARWLAHHGRSRKLRRHLEEPLAIDYGDWRVMTPPPPCSGIHILQTLKILALYEPSRWTAFSEDYLHALVEAIKLARHDRVFEGDWYTSPHTTHFSVGDRDSNVVSSTQTLGAIFGSGVIVEGTGLILNGCSSCLTPTRGAEPHGAREEDRRSDVPGHRAASERPRHRDRQSGRSGHPANERPDVREHRSLRNVAAGRR